jgi:hypothetical protein
VAIPQLRSKLGMPRGICEHILLSMDFDNRGGTFMMIINSNRESVSHHLWLFEHIHAAEGWEKLWCELGAGSGERG